MTAIRLATFDDLQDIARVHVDTWKTTYTGLVPQSYLDAFSYEESENLWKQWVFEKTEILLSLFVALGPSNQIIGFIGCGPNRENEYPFEGEIYALYLLKPFQGQGIGRKLFETSVRHLSEMGFHDLMLWTLKSNPACRFYEKLGGHVIGNKIDRIAGMLIKEIAYGWELRK